MSKRPQEKAAVRNHVTVGDEGLDVALGESQSVDDKQLRSLGYEPQLMRRFSWYQLICCGFMTTNSWLGLVGGFAAGVTTGGTVTVVWGLLIATVACLAVACTLSELISAYPSAGGFYFWAMHLAPRRYSRVSAYITGWANLWGAWFCCAANASAVAGLILASVRIYHPDTIMTTWQYWLVAVGLNLILGIFNLNVSILSKSATVATVISFIGLSFITIAVPAAAKSHTSIKTVFTSTENASGWSSPGMAFILGLINASWCYGLLDSATHLAEEIPRPERNVPKALIATVVVGFLTTFPMSVVLMYCLTDFDAVVAAERTGSPLAELILISTGSQTITLLAMLSVIIVYAFGIVYSQTYQCRLLWSFARDGGVIFSGLWSQVSGMFDMPFNAHVASLFVDTVLTALLLASTTAFNSLITGGLVFSLCAGILPVFWSLWRGSDQKRGPFNLGRFGVCAKVVTLCYCFFTLIMYSFPFTMPATPGNMNYISAIYFVFVIWTTVDWWARARHQFAHVDGIA